MSEKKSPEIYDPVTAHVPGVDQDQRVKEIEAIHSDHVPQPPPKIKEKKIIFRIPGMIEISK